MTTAKQKAALAEKKIDLTIDSDLNATMTTGEVKIEVSPAGNVVAYTDDPDGIELKSSAQKAGAKTGKSQKINFTAAATTIYGAKIELIEGKIAIKTAGTSQIKPARKPVTALTAPRP